jgi:hypothetical protein
MVYEDDLHLDTDGVTECNLSDVLHSLLAYDTPSPTASVALSQTCKRYYVSIGENIFDDDSPISYEQHTTKWAILGGSTNDEHSPNAAALAERSMLTRQPQYRSLYLGEIAMLVLFPDSTGSVTLTALLTYTDGTFATQNIALGTIRQYEPYCVPIGYNARNWASITPSKTIKSITLSALGETITLYPHDSDGLVHYKQFIYPNLLGGYDSLVCRGANSEGIQPTFEEAKLLRTATLPALAPQRKQYNARAQTVFVANTGYKSKSEILGLREMLMRGNAYVVEGGTLRPIVITSQNLSMLDSSAATQWALSFEYTYA